MKKDAQMIFFLSSACLPGRAVRSNRNERWILDKLHNDTSLPISWRKVLWEKEINGFKTCPFNALAFNWMCSIPKNLCFGWSLKGNFPVTEMCLLWWQTSRTLYSQLAHRTHLQHQLFVVCLCYFFFTIDALMLDMHGFHWHLLSSHKFKWKSNSLKRNWR